MLYFNTTRYWNFWNFMFSINFLLHFVCTNNFAFYLFRCFQQKMADDHASSSYQYR